MDSARSGEKERVGKATTDVSFGGTHKIFESEKGSDLANLSAEFAFVQSTQIMKPIRFQ